MKLVAAFAVLFAVAFAASAQEGKEAKKKDARFEAIKGLVGTWESETKEMGKTAITYRLTAAGSTVMETMGAGTAHEMVSMYTMDGEDFILTHYCAMGNQPRMKCGKAAADGSLEFTCTTGGGNMKCDTDSHMHGARFKFVDKDTFNSEWDSMEKGKVAGTYKFAHKRKEK